MFKFWVYIAGLLFSTQSIAAIYHFNIDNPAGSDLGGDILNFTTSYDSDKKILDWSSSLQEVNGQLADRFWLVLSDGPMPKDSHNEYAIFYGDANTGDIVSYVYSDDTRYNSWQNPGEVIKVYSNALNISTIGPDIVSWAFSLDISDVNNYEPTTSGTNDWDGASFDNHIGIWYHPVYRPEQSPTYNEDGSFAHFPINNQNSWYDVVDQETTVVPLPAGLLLLASGLFGFSFFRKKHRNS